MVITLCSYSNSLFLANLYFKRDGGETIQIQALKSKTEFILRLDNDGSVYKRINLQIQLSIQKHNVELNKIEFQILPPGGYDL